MNDEDRELLSAYLDGALPEPERKALEARIAASEALRRELDELRATAQAVRDLPKEPLPPGFMARFQARRARGDAPRQDWVILPPGLRPVALALSCGIVALVIWDKATAPPAETLLHPPGAADVSDLKSGPVSQLNLAAKASGTAGPASAALDSTAAQGIAGAASEPVRRGENLPMLAESAGTAVAGAEKEERRDLPAAGLRRQAQARAAGSPVEADKTGSVAAVRGGGVAERGAQAMTEEERSARNEQMFGFLEGEKKKMGIAKVIAKDDSSDEEGRFRRAPAAAAPKLSAAAPSLLKQTSSAGALQAAPAAPPAAKPSGPPSGRLSPDAGLVFSDPRSLSTSWVLLGMPGLPPSVDFSANRLVVLKPSATKILSVTTQPNSVDVVYRSLEPEETPDPAQDRVAPIPLEPKTVLLFDASPR